MIDKAAYRNGSADAILGKPYENPWTWTNAVKMASYHAGYLHGQFLMEVKHVYY